MTVVVGVDGSPVSHPALRLALQEARCRGSTLLAVMSYGGETLLSAPAALPVSGLGNPEEAKAITEVTLQQVVTAALGADAAQVQTRVVAAPPGKALVEAAHEVGAELVVLASRGDGAMSRLLGAVSQYVLRNAPCPVLVVPAGE